MFIAYLVKKILGDKYVLVTFFTKSVLLLLKKFCEVCGISTSDLVPNAFWYLNTFR